MKKEEKVLQNIERNPVYLLLATLISAGIIYAGYALLISVNPWGVMVLVPGAVLAFQCLWWLLNPFAQVFEDKIEIKQSLFHNKDRYFIDLKRVTETKSGKLYITYNDDEIESLNLFGIKPSHVSLLKSELEKYVAENHKSIP